MKTHSTNSMNMHNHEGHDSMNNHNVNSHESVNIHGHHFHGSVNEDTNMDTIHRDMYKHDFANLDSVNDKDHLNIHSMHDHGGMNMNNGHMMMPWFKATTKEPFLFEYWLTTTVPGLVAALLFSICLAIIYECINYAFNVYNLRTEKWHTRQNKNNAHALLSLLRSVSIVISYVMMLCVMSYNFWILVAVIVGSGVGHLVGRPLISMLINKPRTEKVCDRSAKEPLHDFEPLKGHPDDVSHRKAVTNSLDLNSFQEKLLRYNYNEETE